MISINLLRNFLFMVAVFTLNACHVDSHVETSENTNSAPTASAFTVETTENVSIEASLPASDADGDTLTFVIVTQPANGSISVSGDKATYTPNADFNGTDSFSFKVNDGVSDSEVVMVTINVAALPVSAIATGKLNDTGVTQCADAETSGLSCPITEYPNQDAQHGRDFDNNDDSDGNVGFSFTKLDMNGHELLANAEIWSCVKDNVTGLVWEVKQGGNSATGDEGLHDADDKYNWYTTDASNDGGFEGYRNDDGDICYGFESGNPSAFCNTQDYVARVNTKGLCGTSDWRLPNHHELVSIVSFDKYTPSASIDDNYFPNTKVRFGARYWTSAASAYGTILGSHALVIEFDYGDNSHVNKNLANHVRLVRGK